MGLREQLVGHGQDLVGHGQDEQDAEDVRQTPAVHEQE